MQTFCCCANFFSLVGWDAAQPEWGSLGSETSAAGGRRLQTGDSGGGTFSLTEPHAGDDAALLPVGDVGGQAVLDQQRLAQRFR